LDQKPLAEVVSSAQVLFLCVPSWVLRPVIGEVKQHLSPGTVLVSVAKGVEESTLATMDQVLNDEASGFPYVLLGGPLIAEEVANGQWGVGVAATESETACDAVSEIFRSTNVLIEPSSDVHGVALSGVIKNIYAIGLGAISVLFPGLNFRGWFTAQACKEMGDVVVALGGKKETIYSAAGLGDLIATGFSSDSSNHQAGRELAESGKPQHKSEGVASLSQVVQLLDGNTEGYMLLNMLRRSIMEGKDISDEFKEIFKG